MAVIESVKGICGRLPPCSTGTARGRCGTKFKKAASIKHLVQNFGSSGSRILVQYLFFYSYHGFTFCKGLLDYDTSLHCRPLAALLYFGLKERSSAGYGFFERVLLRAS
jgi:hypothetical protein